MQEEEKNNLIVLPDDYKKTKSHYVVCDVLGVSCDCKLSLDIGDRVLIERSMLLEVKAAGETNYLVLENYVYGRLQDE